MALALVVVICVCLALFFRSLADERARAAEAEVRRLEAVLDDVKEVAWTNRDIAPELATIVIDTIRTAERSHRPELPADHARRPTLTQVTPWPTTSYAAPARGFLLLLVAGARAWCCSA